MKKRSVTTIEMINVDVMCGRMRDSVIDFIQDADNYERMLKGESMISATYIEVGENKTLPVALVISPPLSWIPEEITNMLKSG